MPFEIVRNDIVNMQVDAIVNTANPRPMIGSGTDAAIHAKAGPRLLEARKRIGSMYVGDVCITPGFDLPSKHVIHTVGPVWRGGSDKEEYLLRTCYRQSLKLAWRHGLKSIAFPLISSGNYGFPKQLALQVAREEIEAFLQVHEMQVYLVVFSKDALALSETLVSNVKNFLDERYVQEKTEAEYGFSVSRTYEDIRKFFADIKENNRRKKEERWDRKHQDRDDSVDENMYASEGDGCIGRHMYAGEDKNIVFEYDRRIREPGSGKGYIDPTRGSRAEQQMPFSVADLKERLKETGSSFSESLLTLIDKTGKKDPEIYKKANVDRKLFSKIRNNPYYKPSKATALAFAIALELDLEQTRALIGKAGYALSDSSKFDIIVEYFITHGRYDICEINLILFEFDQVLLGA